MSKFSRFKNRVFLRFSKVFLVRFVFPTLFLVQEHFLVGFLMFFFSRGF